MEEANAAHLFCPMGQQERCLSENLGDGAVGSTGGALLMEEGEIISTQQPNKTMPEQDHTLSFLETIAAKVFNEPAKKSNPIICVDFDGVIHSYTSGWKGADVIPDPPVDGAIAWLLEHLPLPDALGMGGEYVGPEVVIYSSRSKQKGGIEAMKCWLVKWGVDDWYFRDDILKFPTQKPAAFLTIDDRAICFTGKFPTSAEIMAFVPWNKKDAAL